MKEIHSFRYGLLHFVRQVGFEPTKAVPSRLQRDLVDHLSTDASDYEFSTIFIYPNKYLC